MLAVITDDFTGASEIAGVAFAKGFSTVIETGGAKNSEADVLIVATNMRSLRPADAALESLRLTKGIMDLSPEIIFKKVDSVLRGNIGPELEAQMRAERKSRALLVPANPGLHRTISDGIYFIGDTPFAESDFANSNDFEVASSHVVDILGNRGTTSASCISPHDRFNGAGVHVGNTISTEDLVVWANRVDERLVPAGAAEFFAAILDAKMPSPRTAEESGNGFGLPGRSLYVCGSRFPSSRVAVLDARGRGDCVLDMPDEVYFSTALDLAAVDRWADTVVRQFAGRSRVIVAALQTPGQPPGDSRLPGVAIAEAMARVTQRVVEAGLVDSLMIEGGATSESVMRALEISSLYPAQSLAPGVTRMRVGGYPNLDVTMKPGSYRWPESIWNNAQG
ncbi:MAG: four-carbon acid sugar kinase family protein [Pseudomonadota bacterium]